jgi:hypothetical protein
MITLFLLLTACSGTAPDGDVVGRFAGSDLEDDADAAGTDPLDTPAEDCVEGGDALGHITAEPIEGQATVLRVTWDGPAQQDGLVYFEDALGIVRAIPTDDDGTALLVGLHPNSDVWLQTSALVDGERVCSAPVVAQTGSLPAGLAEAQVSGSLDGPATPAFLALPVLTEFDRMAVIYETRTGAPVWMWTMPSELEGGSPIYRVHVRADGGGVLLNVHEAPHSAGGLYSVDWDGSWSFLEVEGASRDFFELEDGTVAVLSNQVRNTEHPLFDDERVVRGDRIIEVRPDGSQTEIWNMFDDTPHDLGLTEIAADQNIEFVEWAHANGITHDPHTNRYVVSLPDVESVAAIDRATGGLAWLLQEGGGDFETGGLNEPLMEQSHSVQVLPDGNLMLFNRRETGGCSDVTEIELDLENQTARPVWTHDSDPCLLVVFLGEGRRLEDGDTVVSWSSAGQVDIIGPDKALRWRLALDLGAGFGFVDHATALGGARID